MLLKRLEMTGFKSFADKTVLDFTEGACGVVGPNGSGKSNISDAIRWVIGETSAKTLRGSNMQDVIFAGTETRRGLSFAEVSLILDNSGREFNVDYEEIKVTRQLFRSGESVYKINDASVRLKDVHELFMDTGLGRDGYSIIGQGNVSQILSTKAEDRRSLFEEAAGVSKYKYKKEEAARKLAKTDENLVRITDILTELEGQLAPLERQSAKAHKYLGIYGEMKQLDINLSVISLDKNRADMQEAERLYNSVSDELAEVHSKESESERLISALYSDGEKAESEKSAANAGLIENEARISKAKNDIVLLRNNIKNNAREAERLKSEIESINSSNESRRALIEAKETEIAGHLEKAKETNLEIASLRLEEEKLSGDIKAIDEKLSQKRDEYVRREGEIASEKERVSGIEALRALSLKRRDAAEAELKAYKEGIKSTGRQLAETENKIAETKKKLISLSETADSVKAAKSQAQARLSEISKKTDELKIQRDTKASQRKMLEGLRDDYAGYAKSVKAVLTAPELRHLAIYGTVAGLCEAEKKYALAIETALGGALQNIITESEEDAKRAIEYLRQNKAGRATFLPITSVCGKRLDEEKAASKCAGFIGIAAELISYDKRYSGIFTSLLGRVVVADNIDNAISISRKFGYRFKIVTLEGDVLNAGGAISGGALGNAKSGFLSRTAQIKTLGAEISAITRDIKRSEEKLESAKGDLALAESQLGSFLPLIREYEDDILRLESSSALLRETLNKSEGKSYEDELKELRESLKKTADEAAEAIAHISALRSKNAVVKAQTEELNEKRALIEEARAEKQSEAENAGGRAAQLEKDIAVAESEIKAAYESIQLSIAQTESKRNDIAEAERSSTQLEELIKEKEKQTEEALSLSETIRLSIAAIDERKAAINEKMQQQRKGSKDITERIIALEKELSRADNKRIRLDSDYDSLINRLWEDYELGYNSARDLAQAVENEKEETERLNALRRRIKALGSVNMDAIEEYKAVKERFEFISAQKGDLESSKRNLIKLIGSMEELMLEHFKARFSEINKSFSVVFRELFGGGHARLYLSDPENVLLSGIEIEVQLPGKGMQNLNLYSGGEKSFIAIALLFAILRVKPTPFCILDEIDAALDDSNVSRFATYLKNYTEHIQFIVITHRRGTMEAASVLYGVTMQEQGVSKLLSLNIDDVSDDLIE